MAYLTLLSSATILLVFIALIEGADKANRQFVCGRSPMKIRERKLILEEHNKLRARIAHGQQLDRDNYYLPKAANMRKLIWDCDLQRSAQNWMNRCEFEHSKNLSVISENVGYFAHSQMDKGRIENGGVEIAQNWWSEVEDYPYNPTNNITREVLSAGILTHFIGMAWAESAKMGCGKCVTQKNGMTYVYVLCQYKPKGVMINQLMYEIGEPCTKCPKGTKCASEGLCA